jgi:hypothetical protein
MISVPRAHQRAHTNRRLAQPSLNLALSILASATPLERGYKGQNNFWSPEAPQLAGVQGCSQQ